jgi:cathepsin E
MFEFTPNAQLWPRALNTLIGGQASDIFLIVADIGNPSSSEGGFDFVFGQVFLERFYTVFDLQDGGIGFAVTPFTNAMTN